MRWTIPSLMSLVCSALTLGACESNDPCAQRKAACLDVTLIGAQSPIFYQNLTVTVTGSGSASLVAPKVLTELRQTAPAGVQGLVTFQLPDSFNELMDLAPEKVIADLPTNEEKTAKLEELRGKDPRAIRIVVEGTETGGGENAKVRWDSQAEEELRLKAAKEDENFDPWLQLRYFRIGKNQYQAAYATLNRATP